MTPPSIFVYAFIPLILWRIYARIRRNIGRQRSRPWRHWFAITVLPLLVVMFAAVAIRNAVAEAAIWGGAAGGVVLALWGLRLTRFERTDEGFFYTPNAYIGVGLSLLLVSRILYRMMQVYEGSAGASASSHPDFARSPLTLLAFGLVAGYYATYSAGLLRWRRRDAGAARL